VKDGNDGLGGWDEGDPESGALDGVIDQALGSYTAREPRAGLDQRVLSAIAAAEAERGRRGWSWKPAWALAAAMALLAVAGIPLSYRLGRQETAVAHGPAVRTPAVGQPVQPVAPLVTRNARHTLTRPFPARGGVANAEPVGMEIAANTYRAPLVRATAAAMDGGQAGDGPDTLTPITLKPITIAPIKIAALN
jgi:hypothetical protein